MRYLKAYIETWGQESVIIPARCLGRFFGCFQGCPLSPKCAFKPAGGKSGTREWRLKGE